MTPFRIQAKAASAPPDGPDVTVEIMDEIGWSSGSAQEFIGAMQAAKAKRPLVRIHSRGGDVLDSLAIRSFLASLDTTVEIFGVAASAASYIATAGRKVSIVENGFVMVHAPWGATMGTSSDMRETADLLDKMETTYVSGYRQKTGKDEATVRGWMAKDTWMTAQEAKDAGLVDEILPPIAFSASASIRAMASIPKALLTDGANGATLDASKTEASTTTTKPTMKHKLLALLGKTADAEDSFLQASITDLGVTPEAIDAARKSGQTDFVAVHIAARIAAADASAKAATDRANAILAAVGVKHDAPDLVAELAKAIDAKASAKAADILASKGINTDVGNAKAATGGDKSKDEIVAEFNAMKPGPERSAFFAKHRKTILS